MEPDSRPSSETALLCRLGSGRACLRVEVEEGVGGVDTSKPVLDSEAVLGVAGSEGAKVSRESEEVGMTK